MHDCPLSEDDIQAALAALASGRNLDPPLERQRALARRGERETLLREHHWLLVALARQRAERAGDPHGLRDWIAAGHPGLLKAQRDWDPERGYRFGTYASFWIRQAFARRRG